MPWSTSNRQKEHRKAAILTRKKSRQEAKRNQIAEVKNKYHTQEQALTEFINTKCWCSIACDKTSTTVFQLALKKHNIKFGLRELKSQMLARGFTIQRCMMNGEQKTVYVGLSLL